MKTYFCNVPVVFFYITYNYKLSISTKKVELLSKVFFYLVLFSSLNYNLINNS